MAKKIKLSLGRIAKVMSIIPDTTELIGKGIDNSRPIIEKYMDHRHQKQESLRKLDNVINMPVEEARKYLETQGFVVATIPARPNKKWLSSSLDEVVAMSPKSGQHPLGSLIKLYYVTYDVLEKSQEILDQENLRIVERNQKIATIFDSLKHAKFPFYKK
ncbi:PASTA domain-containing protein [Streptococcus porcinus]|uniref:PASTA domain-containing protein n=1 Tax=Streptococcus porcinus str. Jelinkova 176 TaxID=873448 RepID=A0ABP2L111_STRPO|nr:PASTA domain-containing protein [Streptococcus porcinus]EGJ27902.1 hypothetical protein STRPO_0396 [Streptococcus porcinus str. Jelinkova 176]SQG44175.1 PnkB-like serine/threonine kinase protein [Streptococcus porcinus]